MNEDLITIARKHGDEVSSGGKVTYEFDSWGLTDFAEELEAAEREKLAQWMIERGYATGHGDTTEDLLAELDWQIAENWTRAMVKGVETEREECAKVCVEQSERWHTDQRDVYVAHECAAAIRARGAP